MDLSTDTFAEVIRYLKIELSIQLTRSLVAAPIIRIMSIGFDLYILGFLIERIALAIFHDRPRLLKVWRDQLGYHLVNPMIFDF